MMSILDISAEIYQHFFCPDNQSVIPDNKVLPALSKREFEILSPDGRRQQQQGECFRFKHRCKNCWPSSAADVAKNRIKVVNRISKIRYKGRVNLISDRIIFRLLNLLHHHKCKRNCGTELINSNRAKQEKHIYNWDIFLWQRYLLQIFWLQNVWRYFVR